MPEYNWHGHRKVASFLKEALQRHTSEGKIPRLSSDLSKNRIYLTKAKHLLFTEGALCKPTSRVDSWVNFCWVCAARLSEPLIHYILCLWPVIDRTLVTSGKCSFSHFLTASLLILNPYLPKFYPENVPNLEVMLKMQLHCSQSRCENMTPSSSTPLLDFH